MHSRFRYHHNSLIVEWIHNVVTLTGNDISVLIFKGDDIVGVGSLKLGCDIAFPLSS